MIYFLPGLTKHTTVMVTTDEYEYEKDDDDHVAAEIEIGYEGNSYLHCTYMFSSAKEVFKTSSFKSIIYFALLFTSLSIDNPTSSC